MTSWPLPKAEWIRWLGKAQATFENALHLANVAARRAFNVRATPHPDAPQKDPAIRLNPHIDTYYIGMETPARFAGILFIEATE